MNKDMVVIMIHEFTENNFKEMIQTGTVIVDFWAPWCGPCKAMNPVIEKIANDNPDIKVGKVNIDEYPHIAREYNVLSIPTIIIFSDGKPYAQNIGIANESVIMEKIRGVDN